MHNPEQTLADTEKSQQINDVRQQIDLYAGLLGSSAEDRHRVARAFGLMGPPEVDYPDGDEG